VSERHSLSLLADVPDAWAPQVDLDILGRAAEAVLGAEGASGATEIELLVVEGEEIRRMNAEFRGRDEVTDVLSFPLHEPEANGFAFVGPPDEVDRLGDIVICLPRAQEQAEEYGHSLQRELAYLFVHGLLHLLGYDHETDDEREHMRRKEEAALAVVGLTR
jgi:probable rRNA maturation factor